MRTYSLMLQALRSILLTATSLVLMFPAGADAAEATRKYAFLVSINQYSGAPRLDFAEADVAELKKEFLKVGFGAGDIVHLSNSEATHDNIVNKFKEFVGRIKDENTLLVFAFSGHGCGVGEQSCLVPVDINQGASKLVFIKKHIYEPLAMCKASQKILIFDACRSKPTQDDFTGGTAKSLHIPKSTGFLSEDDEKLLLEAFRSPDAPLGTVTLSSSSQGKVSIENKELKHGVFCHYLLEGLRGRAEGFRVSQTGAVLDPQPDDVLTVVELFEYARFHTIDYTEQKQIPTIAQSEAASGISICSFPRLSFTGDLRFDSRFSKANIGGLHLRNANFEGCDLSGLDLSGLELFQANFKNAKLVKTNFSRCNLYSCVFDDANCEGADFRSTQTMVNVKARNANFYGAKMPKRVYPGSDFSGAKFNSETTGKIPPH